MSSVAIRNYILLFALILTILLCSVYLVVSQKPTATFSGSNELILDVLYATNRKATGSGCSFGGERASSNKLSYGLCNVSIPPDHRIGEIESPFFSWLPLDPAKHVVLRGGTGMPKSVFDGYLSESLKQSGSSLVFVHGYNVAFEDAAKRTAQMTYDLKFKGAPIFFSWPSAGAPEKYPADEATIEWSYPAMHAFLLDHLERVDVKNVYLIAHSMGNRALTHAVTKIYTDRPDLAAKVKEIVLTAPDIDAGTFMDVIVPEMIKGDAPITLYVSSRDKALILSKGFHSYPRAGDFPNPVRTVPGLELIDATTVETDFLAHSYYGDNSSVISDLYSIIKGDRPSERFHLQAKGTGEGLYWEFRK